MAELRNTEYREHVRRAARVARLFDLRYLNVYHYCGNWYAEHSGTGELYRAVDVGTPRRWLFRFERVYNLQERGI